MGSYVRQDRIARRTGTRVCLFDTRSPENIFDPAGGRWVTVCMDHGAICNHETLYAARAHSTEVDWCEECQGVPNESPWISNWRAG